MESDSPTEWNEIEIVGVEEGGETHGKEVGVFTLQVVDGEKFELTAALEEIERYKEELKKLQD